MATKADKSDRRWYVVKSLLIALAVYTTTIVGLVYNEVTITPLEQLTTLVFSLVSILGIGNWMTVPTED